VSAAAKLGLLMSGFFAGSFAFAAVGRWIYALSEIKRTPGGRLAILSRLITATILGAGPWLIFLLGLCAYYLRSEPWMLWVVVGFCVAVAFFCLLTLYLWRKGMAQNGASVAEVPEKPALLARIIRYTASKRGGIIFSYVVALIVGVVVAPSLFPGQDVPVMVWVIIAILWFGMSHLMNWFMWTFVHPKPWVERRKTPRSE
jgi:hypothetical protein